MKFYITTPIYYVNAQPHIGHSYTNIAGDCLARFYRLTEKEVFFLTGTDEHGDKILQSAQKENIKPQDYVDKMSQKYKDLWTELGISYDKFIRTTEEQHQQTVKSIFEKLLKKDDIYPGEYKGYYCIYCENFIPKTKAGDNIVCPDCLRPVQIVSEKSYFFRLSKYQTKLKEYLKTHKDFIQPSFRYDEVYNFIEQGLEDLSVTRASTLWGITSPTPEKFPIYVWFDALINYLTASDYLIDNNKFNQLWPPSIQLIGKDILRFHDIIWPAMLLSLDVELPQKIFAHGWWILGKEKISKSRGNIINPLDVAKKWTVDGFRYFLLREVPFGLDGEYSEEKITKRYNSDLANDFGNLVNRTLNLMEKKHNNALPEKFSCENIYNLAEEIKKSFEEKMAQLAFSESLEQIWKLVSYLNKYLDTEKPWNLQGETEEKILYQCMEGIRILSIFLFPFIPFTSKKIWDILNLDYSEKTINFSEIKKPFQPGHKIKTRTILFERIK
jgi:methionyl-tRNA synthetase